MLIAEDSYIVAVTVVTYLASMLKNIVYTLPLPIIDSM